MNQILKQHLKSLRGQLSKTGEVLFQSYTALLPIEVGPLNAFAPILSYGRFKKPEEFQQNLLVLQRIMPPAFRSSLADFLDIPEVGALSPLQSTHSKPQAWHEVCHAINRFDELDETDQHNLCHVLLCLGFFELVYFLLRRYGKVAASPKNEALKYLHAFVRYILNVGNPKYRPDDLEDVCVNSSSDGKIRFLSSCRLLAFYCRVQPDLPKAMQWKGIASSAIEKSKVPVTSFAGQTLRSRFYRAAALESYLRHDINQASDELDRCVTLARQAKRAFGSNDVLWAANLFPALQAQVTLHRLNGQMQEALGCTQEMIGLDPWYSTSHIELGNVLIELDEVHKAADAFSAGALLGPPTSHIAAFEAACCYKLMGDIPNEIAMSMLCHSIDGTVQAIQGKIRGTLSAKQKSAVAACLYGLEVRVREAHASLQIVVG